jgi:Flp pilus assembly protein TadG
MQGSTKKAPLAIDARTEGGQAVIEAALVLVLLIILLMALLDLGRAYFTYLALQNAAGEGAAYGMINPTWWQGDDVTGEHYHEDPNNIIFRVRSESPSGLVSWGETRVTVKALFLTPGNPITVTVDFDYELITPFARLFSGDGTITLRGQAVQSIISPGS